MNEPFHRLLYRDIQSFRFRTTVSIYKDSIFIFRRTIFLMVQFREVCPKSKKNKNVSYIISAFIVEKLKHAS